MYTPRKKLLLAGTLLASTVLITACNEPNVDDRTGMPEAPVTVQDGIADDAQVTNAVHTAIAADGELQGLNISVETRKGDVKLTGYVDNDQQRRKAERIALATAGAHSVHNELKVRQ